MKTLHCCAALALAAVLTSQLRAEDVDFEKQIKPLLESRCAKCHGAEKPKGKFNMLTRESLMKGGDQGESIVPGNAEESLLFEVITLDDDDPDRMPAEGDPLSEAEIELVKKWINEGAKWPKDLKLTAPEVDDPLKRDPLNTPGLPISDEEKVAVENVKKMGALALRIAQNTNWLRVDFSLNSKIVDDEKLSIVQPMANLVELDLGGTTVSDAGLANIKGLTNLHKLHLEKTKVTGPGLEHLAGMQELRYLNLYGSEVTDDGLKHLHGLKKLKKLYLWQTKVSDEGVEALKKALPELYVNRGLDVAKVEPKEEEKKEEVKKEDAEKAKAKEKKEAEAKQKKEADKKKEVKKDEAKKADAKKDEAKEKKKAEDEGKKKAEKKEKEASKEEKKPEEKKQDN